MFAGWGSRVARLRWSVLAVALVAVISSGVWGFGVFGQLTEGGYNDPSSESARAADVAAESLGGQSGDVTAIYTPDQGTIDDAALTKRITERLGALPGTSVSAQNSYWAAEGEAKARFAAEDKSSAVAVITLTGDDDAAKMEAFDAIAEDFTVPGARVELAGGVPLGHASSELSTSDLMTAELISLPIVLILLLLIFGSLVAAALPVLIGGAAVLGALGVLNAVALTHEVNSFAVNVASLLGLGMAIDYGLFMVGRFREEQAIHSTPEAVRRTVATAGRTVVFSATLLMTALAGLLLFPQGFLKSLAYGGLAAVFFAALLSLTLLPAILAILGPKVDRIPIRLPGRGGSSAGSSAGWEKLAGFVLRRPVLVAVPILAVLVLLALPITNAEFGENDERVLPAGEPSRVAIETLKTDYPQFSTDGVQIVVRGTDGERPDVTAFTEAVGKVSGVTEVGPSGQGEDVVVLNAALESADEFSAAARDVVEELRALPAPPSSEVLVGGATARNVDSLTAIADKLPLMIGLLVGATLILMFLAFGSILLPLKAVVMSALSLGATFGILIWIFQEGHGADLLNVTPAPLEAGIVVLMAAVVFGLSTDYEVFLLSRMVEARLKGSSTAEAVTVGLARTGRVISAAALLLIVVTGAFALSSVTTMRFVGVGMIVALLLDATVVRMLLVPAVLRLLGDAAWWAPGPLRRLQERAGLAEHAGEDEVVQSPPPPVDSTQVITGTIALPAATQAAALTAGGPPATVVLDYNAVLDYLAEKEQGGGLPGEVTRRLPLVSGVERDAPVGETVDVPQGDEGVDDSPVDEESSPEEVAAVAAPPVPEAPVSDAPVPEAPVSGAPVSAGGDEVQPILAEVELQIAAAAEPAPILAEVEAQMAAETESEAAISGEELTRSEEPDSPVDAVPSAEVADPTAADEPVDPPAADEPEPSSSVSTGEPVLTPALAESDAERADEESTPVSPAVEAVVEPVVENEPSDEQELAADLEPESDREPVTEHGSVPVPDAQSVPEAEPLPAPVLDAEPLDEAFAEQRDQPSSEPLDEPVEEPTPPAEPTVESSIDSTPETPAAAEPAQPEEDLFAWRSDPRIAGLSATGADGFGWLDRSAMLPEAPKIPDLPAPHPEPAAWTTDSPAAWQSESSTSWPSESPATSQPIAQQPETPAPWQPDTSTPWQPQTAASAQPETPAPWQPDTSTPWQPEPPAPWQPVNQLPDAVLPYPFPERTPGSRPENLSDWLGKAPADPDRPQPLEVLSTGPDQRPQSLEDLSARAERRPQHLEDLSTSDPAPEPERPTRPQTLGDLPSAPVSSADTAPTTPEADTGTPSEEPAQPEAPADDTTAEPFTADHSDTVRAVAPVSSGAPGYIRRPQTLDEWLNGGPTTPERPRTLGDLPTAPTAAIPTSAVPTSSAPTSGLPTSGAPGIRRPKTLDDWLTGTTPEEPPTRPATLADNLDASRSPRSGNDRTRSWTSGTGENEYDRPPRRPASLADHPGPNQRPDHKPTGDPNPDHSGPDHSSAAQPGTNERPDRAAQTNDPDPTPQP